VSATEGEGRWPSGPSARGGLGADRRARVLGRACAKRYPWSGPCDQDRTEGIRGRPRAQGACTKRYPRSGTCDQDRTEGIRPGKNRRLQAALLLSAAVRSPELKLARARVALGSPELGREEEGATANSMAGKGVTPGFKGQSRVHLIHAPRRQHI
jgi:hypothetical protein